MTRRQIRENVFRILFRIEFHDKDEFQEQLGLFDNELLAKIGDTKSSLKSVKLDELDYLNQKASDVVERLEEIDKEINERTTGWKTGRMGKADLTILRLAVYEIRYEEDIPFKVSVNEAVELAKKYGTDESAAFINGVLAKFA